MPEKLNINYANGEEREADLICYLNVDNIGKVVMYTFNEKGDGNLEKIHIAKVTEENGGYTFNKIDDENQWNIIKNIMREIIAGGAN